MTIRDGGRCRFPGCENRIVDGHHIVHWSRGGATCIDNVVSACRRHHGLLHEGGFSVEAVGDDRGPNPAAKRHGAEGSAACHAADFVWRDREGQIIEPLPPRPPAPPLLTDEIDPFAASAKSDSWWPIDWSYVIEVRTDQLGWVPRM